jgi:hypothetical protein
MQHDSIARGGPCRVERTVQRRIAHVSMRNWTPHTSTTTPLRRCSIRRARSMKFVEIRPLAPVPPDESSSSLRPTPSSRSRSRRFPYRLIGHASRTQGRPRCPFTKTGTAYRPATGSPQRRRSCPHDPRPRTAKRRPLWHGIGPTAALPTAVGNYSDSIRVVASIPPKTDYRTSNKRSQTSWRSAAKLSATLDGFLDRHSGGRPGGLAARCDRDSIAPTRRDSEMFRARRRQ